MESDTESDISVEIRGPMPVTRYYYAFFRLTNDAMTLLEHIAFLDPECIPVELFIGESDVDSAKTDGWQYWDINRFNDAVGSLRECKLVSRSSQGGRDWLHTNESVQEAVLQRLDWDIEKRAIRFDAVIAMIRKAVPKAGIINRSDSSQFQRYKEEIESALKIFVRSKTAIVGSVSFASLLHDFAFNLFATFRSNDLAMFMAETGEDICKKLPDDPEAKLLLPTILNTMSQLLNYRGIEGRERGLEMMRRVVKLREEELQDIPPESWTELQSVNFARAHADLAWELCEFDMLDEAAPLIEIAAQIYRRTDNTIRLAQVSVNELMFLSTRQEKHRTMEQSRQALGTLYEALGKDNPLCILMDTQAALAYFTVGEVSSALETMTHVFQRYRKMLGVDDHLTLAAQYCIAVFYHNLGQLEQAESNLLFILNDTIRTYDWREEDIMRTKFRLSIVLKAQNRHVEAATIRQDIDPHLRTLRGPNAKTEHTDADDMQMLDYSVTLCHGRTAGIWGTKDRW